LGAGREFIEDEHLLLARNSQLATIYFDAFSCEATSGTVLFPMTRLERRVFFRSLFIGALLTLLVLGANALGLLDSLEYWLYDQRAIHCQLAEPPPTSRFVHLDIDDASVSPMALGRWPWPREKLARILDEIHLAKPSAIGLDIMFAEPQENRLVQSADGKVTTETDDGDLIGALRRCGNTILAASFKVESGEAEFEGPPQAIDWLTDNLEMSHDEFAGRLRQAGDTQSTGQALQDLILRLRRQAMKLRIDAELKKGRVSEEQLVHRLLPGADSLNDGQALKDLLHQQYTLATAEEAVARFGAPLQPMELAPAPGDLNVVPLAPFSDAAAECAFANYDIFDNATVRSIPLYVQYKNRLYPQMGLAVACVMLGANPAQARFEGSNVVIPAPGKPIVIPTYTYHSSALGRDVPLIAAVPWFGTRDWETMYDWPSHKTTAGHISIAAIWDICTARQVIESNARNIDLAIAFILDDKREDHLATDPDLANKYAAAIPGWEDVNAREKMAQKTIDALKQAPIWLDTTPDSQLSANDRFQKSEMREAMITLQTLMPKYRRLHDQMESRRQWLTSQIAGKGVLVGFTATGLTDLVSTSLHTHCPGVVVHGVIVNAVLKNYWWKMAPGWVTVILTIFFGLCAAAIQGRFSPLRASFFILSMLLIYLLINGYILFDWHKWVVGVAAPSVAMCMVWGGCTLDRLIVEGVERNRIALENAVISKEMDLARQVQVALIPTSAPKIVGIESQGWALTASVTGGDCYDLWQLKDGRLAILLADASGHGLAPAMIVSQVRTLARSLCEFENHPYGLLARINRRLADDLETTRFVTAFLAFLSSDGILEWASAGHGPMFWAPTNSGEMRALDSTGLPLGIMAECFTNGPPDSLNLGEHGSLIVFSDGIFEAHAPDGEMFGVDRVKDILEKTNGRPCEPILEALRKAVQEWQQKLEPEDDQTIVVVRRVENVS
jgi:CHASE2 domain-containing sensor protein